MILLNFSHPLTATQRDQIEARTGASIARVIDAAPQFDDQAPFGPQVDALLAQVELTPAQWQHEPLLIVPPAYNFIAVMVLADLHGRMGYFPPIVRIRPVADTVPRQFEVAEVIDLQSLREEGRRRR